MNWFSVFIASITIFAAGCVPNPGRLDICKAELADINSPGLEQIGFVRDESGEAGFAFVGKSCEYPLPLSISSMPVEDRVSLNHLVVNLIEENPSQRGIGIFEAQCDCDYDEAANVVRARSIISVRRFKADAADQVGEDR